MRVAHFFYSTNSIHQGAFVKRDIVREMQASREDAKHTEERRALSNSPLSTNVVERLCLPMAYPSGTAMAPAPSPGPRSSLAESEGETPRDSSPSAPAAETKSRPLSSADVRLLRAATESDQLGGPALVEVISRWRDIAPDTADPSAVSAATPTADAAGTTPTADAGGNSGAVRRSTTPPADAGACRASVCLLVRG